MTRCCFAWISVSLALGFGGGRGGPESSTVEAFSTTHQQQVRRRLPQQQRKRSSGTDTVVLFAKGWKQGPPPKVVAQTETIYIDRDGNDAWKTIDAANILNEGGMGVLPTESGYGFVTKLDGSSGDGLERILRIKERHGCGAPLALLASDLATIDGHCFGIHKNLFKTLKRNLPGPCTFVLPAKTNTVPRGVYRKGNGKRGFATVQVRMPGDPVLRYLQDELLGGEPLLVSSLPVEDNDDDDDEDNETQGLLLNCSLDPDVSWCNDVDFIVDAGERPYDGSAIFDATQMGEPELVREGLGELELVV